MTRRSRFRLPVALGVVLVTASSAVWPCGLEDASSLSALRGFLNITYPNSLHVGTAIWQAQRAGALPRDDLAPRNDMTPETRGMMRLVQANALIRALAVQLGSAGAARDRPAVSVVMVGPVLWSRLEPWGETVLAKVHVAGPLPGDVVIVTDTPALRALVNGEMAVAKALDAGLVRMYGERAKVEAARMWLAGLARP